MEPDHDDLVGRRSWAWWSVWLGAAAVVAAFGQAWYEAVAATTVGGCLDVCIGPSDETAIEVIGVLAALAAVGGLAVGAGALVRSSVPTAGALGIGLSLVGVLMLVV